MAYRPLPQFAGGTYRDPNRLFSVEECINLYPTRSQSPASRAEVGLRGVPGLVARAECGSGPHRGAFYMDDRYFCVSGDGFYEVDALFTVTRHGDVVDDGTPASICSNGDGGLQLFIVSGKAGYTFNLSTNTLTQITDPDFPTNNAVMGAFLGGYGLVLLDNTAIFQFSALEDFSTWDALDINQKSKSADRLRALLTMNDEIALVGSQSTETWLDTGDALVPMQPVQGGRINMGTGARWSVCKLDNTYAMVGETEARGRCAVLAEGYNVRTFSNPAVEAAWARYSTISDARAWSYGENGQLFYVVTFPSAGETWVYDASLAQTPGLAWHKRLHWDSQAGRYTPYLGSTHAYAFERHLVGSRLDGTLYEQRQDVYTFGSAPRRWQRAIGAVTAGMSDVRHNALALDCLVGRAPISGDGSDPQVMMDWSDDGGVTYGREYWRSLGQIGEYRHTIEWHGLGSTQGPHGRSYRWTGVDPVDIMLFGAFADVTGGR